MYVTASEVTTIISIILGVGAIIGMVFKVIMPLVQVSNKLSEHEETLTNYKEIIQEAKKRDDVILNALLDLLNNVIDGNGKENMKKTRKKILERLSIK